jgi:hypothetical protein
MLAVSIGLLTLIGLGGELWGMAFLFSHLGILNSPNGGWGVVTMAFIVISEKVLIVSLVWIGIRHLLPVLREEIRETTPGEGEERTPPYHGRRGRPRGS